MVVLFETKIPVFFHFTFTLFAEKTTLGFAEGFLMQTTFSIFPELDYSVIFLLL